MTTYLTILAGLKGLLFGYVTLVNAAAGRWWEVGLFGAILALLLVQRAIYLGLWARWAHR